MRKLMRTLPGTRKQNAGRTLSAGRSASAWLALGTVALLALLALAGCGNVKQRLQKQATPEPGDIVTAFVGDLASEASAYMDQFGATQEDAARVAVRDRKNAMNNPHAHLRKPVTVDEIMNSPMLAYPIKLGDVCPRTDGACAVVLAADGVAQKITPKPAWFAASAVRHTYTWFGDSTNYTESKIDPTDFKPEAM